MSVPNDISPIGTELPDCIAGEMPTFEDLSSYRSDKPQSNCDHALEVKA
jgi:hypothetical protein